MTAIPAACCYSLPAMMGRCAAGMLEGRQRLEAAGGAAASSRSAWPEPQTCTQVGFELASSSLNSLRMPCIQLHGWICLIVP